MALSLVILSRGVSGRLSVRNIGNEPDLKLKGIEYERSLGFKL